MEKLVVTPEAYGPFFRASGTLELCEASGQTLGFFVRSGDGIVDDPKVYEWAKSQISDEELERRRANPGTLRSTAEVLERLKLL